jgi:hypothetical protein
MHFPSCSGLSASVAVETQLWGVVPWLPQLAEPQEVGGPPGWMPGADGQAGITIRLYSQRLWVITVGIEHFVMLMRVMILGLAPARPAWIDNAEETMNFRMDQWKTGIRAMRDAHQSLEVRETHTAYLFPLEVYSLLSESGPRII